MKKQTLLTALTAALMGYASAASAITSSSLSSLSDGGSLSIGDKTFSNFSFTDSGLTSFNASQIVVTASVDSSGIYYLTWGGNISLLSSGASAVTADLLLNYTVTATGGLINMIDQSYAGGASPNGTGNLIVTETVRGSTGNLVLANSQLSLTDLSDPFAEAGDNLFINPPQAVLNVTKDIALGTIGTNSLVSLSQVSQSFHQTSVPDGGMTVMLLGAGLSVLAIVRRKIAA